MEITVFGRMLSRWRHRRGNAIPPRLGKLPSLCCSSLDIAQPPVLPTSIPLHPFYLSIIHTIRFQRFIMSSPTKTKETPDLAGLTPGETKHLLLANLCMTNTGKVGSLTSLMLLNLITYTLYRWTGSSWPPSRTPRPNPPDGLT
jgi:hypothetical protein